MLMHTGACGARGAGGYELERYERRALLRAACGCCVGVLDCSVDLDRTIRGENGRRTRGALSDHANRMLNIDERASRGPRTACSDEITFKILQTAPLTREGLHVAEQGACALACGGLGAATL